MDWKQKSFVTTVSNLSLVNVNIMIAIMVTMNSAGANMNEPPPLRRAGIFPEFSYDFFLDVILNSLTTFLVITLQISSSPWAIALSHFVTLPIHRHALHCQ